MAGAILTAPSTTPTTATEWTRELAYTEGARYGYDGVSLTEWASGNTTISEIAAGSTLEINGSMCEYASDTALTTTGIADGWCYIKHVVSGTVVTPTLVNSFGTWDTAKQGYYDGSGNRYSPVRMYRSGAVTKVYTEKGRIAQNQDDVNTYFTGAIQPSSMGSREYTSGSLVATGTSEYIVPVGLYCLRLSDGGGGSDLISLQLQDSSSSYQI